MIVIFVANGNWFTCLLCHICLQIIVEIDHLDALVVDEEKFL